MLTPYSATLLRPRYSPRCALRGVETDARDVTGTHGGAAVRVVASQCGKDPYSPLDLLCSALRSDRTLY